MKKHNEKEQFKIVLSSLLYVVSNWRSILVVYGTVAALIGTLGTVILNKVVIPSARPVVRPIFDKRFETKIAPVEKRLDSLELKLNFILKPIE